jgi:hypothetical protein
MAAELQLFINPDGSVSGTDGESDVAVPFDIEGHLVGKTPNRLSSGPTVAAGTQSSSVSITGNDSALSLSGTGTASIGTLFVVTFAVPFAATPRITVEETGQSAKASHFYVSAKSATGFTISSLTAPGAVSVTCDVIVVG